MPSVCCVPYCRGNTKNGPKVHCFRFPTQAKLLQKWIEAIPRSNFTPTKGSKVCHLHFKDECIMKNLWQVDSRTGKVYSCNLTRLRLRPGAVPSIFKNPPENFPTSQTSSSSSEEESLPAATEIVPEIKTEQISIESVKMESPENLETFDFPEFFTLFGSLQLPKNWFQTIFDKNIYIFKIVHSTGPMTNYTVVVNSNLKVECYLFGQEVSASSFKTPFILSNVDQILELLKTIDQLPASGEYFISNSDNLEPVVHEVALLDSNKLDVISDPKKSEYSLKGTTLASILLVISPTAYQFVSNSNFLKLQPSKALGGICQEIMIHPDSEQKYVFPSTVRKLTKVSNEKERLVILLINEISINPHLKFKDSNLIYTFTISSICSDLKELICVTRTSRINYKSFHKFIRSMIIAVEEVGFRVFCVVTNTNSINGKAMSKFAKNNNVSIVYPHPVCNDRPLFFLYNPTNILKCIKHDWLDVNQDQSLTYPVFDSGKPTVANFKSVKRLYELETRGLNFHSSLNLNEVFSPSQEEGMEAEVALKIFSTSVVEALLQCEQHMKDGEKTADFIRVIVKWWNVVNDIENFGNLQSVSANQEPFKTSGGVNFKSEFLENVLNWLEVWKDGEFPRKLSAQTHSALYHTIHGLLEVTRYCFYEHGIDSLFLSKFQTDPLEHRFPVSRYFTSKEVSVRRLYLSQGKLVIQSWLKLTSQQFGEIPVRIFYVNAAVVEEPRSPVSFAHNIRIDKDDFEKIQEVVPTLTYLSSSCCYMALKQELSCKFCREKLVYPEELIVEDPLEIVQQIGKHDSLYPRDVVVQIVLRCYLLFNKLIGHYERDFNAVEDRPSFLLQLVMVYLAEDGYLSHFSDCSKHNSEVIVRTVASAALDTFFGNYDVEINDVNFKVEYPEST